MNDKLLYKDQKLCEHFQKTFVVLTKSSSTISPRLTCFNLLSLDINECSDGTHICEDLCINTELVTTVLALKDLCFLPIFTHATV